jgi:hypothetical protein
MKHDSAIAGRASPLSAAGVFSPYARDIFAECYPETPHKLRHTLHEHPLLAHDALAALGDETGDGTAGDTIRGIATAGGRAVLRNIEQQPVYRELLQALISELEQDIMRRTGKIAGLTGSLFVAAPGAATPYHFDAEHSIMVQLAGSKVMTQFPPRDPLYASDEAHEAFHTRGVRELEWHDGLAAGGIEWTLEPGDAVYVPAMAPHHVKVGGTKPAVSLSIGWHSGWSLDEADARAFNAQLRRLGIKPRPPQDWPANNQTKALLWRAWRRFLYRRR